MKQQVIVSHIIQPAFYKSFECIGGKCPLSCCVEWDVLGWSENEYTKLKGANMSDELRQKVEAAFTVNTKKEYDFEYTIKYAKGRRCPMLTENGLCMIQKELGAEYLSHTCTVYPRDGYICGKMIIRTCNLSCNHVLDIICSDEDSMKLEIIQHEKSHASEMDLQCPYTVSEMKELPICKYGFEIFNSFYELLSDKTRSVETSIVLAAMTAKKLDEFIEKGQGEKIPEILKALEKQLCDPVQIEKLENAKSNPTLRANFAAGLLKLLKGSNIYNLIFDDEVLNLEKWQDNADKFNEIFKDKPFAMRNIALNLFIASRVPFRDRNVSIFDNFSYFAAQLSVIKFLSVVAPAQGKERLDQLFEISVAYVDRSFTHDVKNFNKVIDYMKDFGVTTPAMLLGIIK